MYNLSFTDCIVIQVPTHTESAPVSVTQVSEEKRKYHVRLKTDSIIQID